MKASLAGVGILLSLWGTPVAAQPFATELNVTAGYSTEGSSVAATQLRVFGDLKSGWRLYLEGAWGVRSVDDSDAFGAAYPYCNRLQPVETYAERTVHTRRFLTGVRIGRYRTPFGIYSQSDHAYSGFLRAPLIRYEDHFGLSSFWLEGGADFFIGTPKLQLEASLGVPQEGEDPRRRGLDAVVRVQAYHGPWILGASYITTRPFQQGPSVHGRARYTGLDWRWMRSGLQLRGEWITGSPFHGATADGWYLDGLLHRPFTGPVTFVVRYEEAHHRVGSYSSSQRRFTTGARVHLTRSVAVHVNLVHPVGSAYAGNTAVDVGLTYTVRH
ncbi:MAG: hypothetical protein HY320_06055 [Armatimonadetes bacterium]|nr:hypothetical protein [Armatimonadota bacterium]